MPDAARPIDLPDDIAAVFEALSDWCRERKIRPDSLEGSRAASRLFDFFNQGCDDKARLLAALRSDSLKALGGI